MGEPGIGVWNEADVQRLIDLGCRPEVVRSVGHLKFDAAELETRTNLNVANMLQQVGLKVSPITQDYAKDYVDAGKGSPGYSPLGPSSC